MLNMLCVIWRSLYLLFVLKYLSRYYNYRKLQSVIKIWYRKTYSHSFLGPISSGPGLFTSFYFMGQKYKLLN